jgi:hypothetical protein
MAAERTLTAVRARDLLNDVLQRVSGEGLRVFTVKEWFDHFAKQKRKSKSEKTALRHEQMHEEFLAFLGPRANLNIAAITQKDFSISETNAKPFGAMGRLSFGDSPWSLFGFAHVQANR